MAVKLVSKSSLSNSCRHLANADMTVNLKKENHCITLYHCITDVIFPATSKVQNYQTKTGEKSLYPSKYVLATY